LNHWDEEAGGFSTASFFISLVILEQHKQKGIYVLGW